VSHPIQGTRGGKATLAVSWWRPATLAIVIVGAIGFVLPLLFMILFPHADRHFTLRASIEFACLAAAPVLFLFGLQPELSIVDRLDAAALNAVLYGITALVVLLVRRHAPRLRPSLLVLLGLWLVCVSITLMPWFR
jgi:hypothetical protein